MNLAVVISLIVAGSIRGLSSGACTQTSERDIQGVSPLRARALKPATQTHAGDPIHLGFAIENVSPSDLWLQPGLLHYNVRAVVTDSRGKKVAYKDENRIICAAPITGKKQLIQLSPNSSVTFNDVTHGLLVLNKPGTYDVSLSYFVVRPELVRALGFRLEPIKAMRLDGIRVVVGSPAPRHQTLEKRRTADRPTSVGGDKPYDHDSLVAPFLSVGESLRVAAVPGSKTGYQLQLASPAGITVVRGLSTLQGHVRILSAEQALCFVRLRTSPRTCYTFDDHPLMEVARLRDLNRTFLFGAQRLTHGLRKLFKSGLSSNTGAYLEGTEGLITDKAFARNHFVSASCKFSGGRFVIRRSVVQLVSRGAKVLDIVEAVGSDGKYVVLSTKAHGMVKRIPWVFLGPDAVGPF